jgi:hypothetical protein
VHSVHPDYGDVREQAVALNIPLLVATIALSCSLAGGDDERLPEAALC